MPQREDESSFDTQFDAKIYLGMDDSAFTGQFRLEMTTRDTDWVDVQNNRSVTLIKKDNDIIGRAGDEDAFKVSLQENGIVDVVQYRSLVNNTRVSASPINVSAQIKNMDGKTQWVSTPVLIDLNLVQAEPTHKT